MSGDVGEVENSITSSLDMLIKEPYHDYIVFYNIDCYQLEVKLFSPFWYCRLWAG